MSEYDLPLDLALRAEKATIRTQTRHIDGMRYLDPQSVLDLLPSEIRQEIDLDHFKAVLHASHALFVETQHRQVARNALKHLMRIETVTK